MVRSSPGVRPYAVGSPASIRATASRRPTLGFPREMLRRARLVAQLARPRRYLLVQSHMRSYSSLLCHILNSHDEIAGYVETHRAYKHELDLMQLVFEVHRTAGTVSGRYVLDKCLHNYVEMAPRILQRDDVYTVFSVREPERTIKSTIAMASRKKDPGWKGDPEKVVRYYERRLAKLVEIAGKRPAHSLYFDADDLVGRTDLVLAELGTFLDLKTPLSSRYETEELTGKPSYGDPGKYIGEGTIVRDRDDYDAIELSVEVARRGKEAYEEARAQLSRLCQHSLRAE